MIVQLDIWGEGGSLLPDGVGQCVGWESKSSTMGLLRDPRELHHLANQQASDSMT